MSILKRFKQSDRLRRFLRWAIWGASLFFIAQALIDNWSAVTAIELTEASWGWLGLAWAISLLAHGWAGWVWHWLLQAWDLPLGGPWAIRVYLFTNVAKYLPGNIWHFYGRVRAVRQAGGGLGRAIASVVAEPLVMAVAAVGIGAITSALLLILSYLKDVGSEGHANKIGSGPLWTLGLFIVWLIALILLQPRLLNPRLAKMSRSKASGLAIAQRRLKFGSKAGLSKAKTSRVSESVLTTNEIPQEPTEALEEDIDSVSEPLRLKRYPLRPLLGETGFVLGRSLGFIATVAALTPLSLADWPALISAFSLAWVLGLIVPGAPGGIGIFEASAIVLLNGQLPEGIVLGSVACYRLVSTLAEVVGAAGAWLAGQQNAFEGKR